MRKAKQATLIATTKTRPTSKLKITEFHGYGVPTLPSS
jgi:hypothetical protein